MKPLLIAALVLGVAACSKSLAEDTKSKAASFKARACACAVGDNACLDKVDAEHEPWSAGLDQRLDGKVTQEEHDAIESVESAYRVCVADRRE